MLDGNVVVARRRTVPSVVEQFAHQWQVFVRRHGQTGSGMAQVMQAKRTEAVVVGAGRDGINDASRAAGKTVLKRPAHPRRQGQDKTQKWRDANARRKHGKSRFFNTG